MTRPAATFGVGVLAGAFMAAAAMFFSINDVRPTPDCETVLVVSK